MFGGFALARLLLALVLLDLAASGLLGVVHQLKMTNERDALFEMFRDESGRWRCGRYMYVRERFDVTFRGGEGGRKERRAREMKERCEGGGERRM